MCGIAGYVGTRRLDEAAVVRCVEALRQRGPDDSGVRRFAMSAEREVCLVNRRLRIIDLDQRASQPFEYDGQWHHLQRRALQLRRVAARARARGELRSAPVRHRGLAAAHRPRRPRRPRSLRGHVGVRDLRRARRDAAPLRAIDSARSRSICYRDATGLYFASEARCIEALVGRHLSPNFNQLRRYLVNGYKSLYKSGETFIEGVTELAPGSWLQIDAAGRETTGRYWNPSIAPNPAMQYEEAVAGVRDHLEQAVSLRLRADVPLAFCLSSGVDSNAIAAIAKRVCGYDLHGFTVVDPDPRYNEDVLASAAAQALGIRHTRVLVSSDRFLDSLREQVRYHDAPVATISYFVHWQLMQQIQSAGYRVSVSGTGADELFSGYYDHHLFYLAAIQGRRGTAGGGTPRLGGARQTDRAEPVPERIGSLRQDAVVSRSHLSRCRGFQRLSRPAMAGAVCRAGLHVRRRFAQPDVERAPRRVGAGHPARRRPQRHVLLDRESLAVSRPVAVRVCGLDSDPAPGAARFRKGRAS